MTRERLKREPLVLDGIASGELSYKIRLQFNIADNIKMARQGSGMSWSIWIHSAIRRLKEESSVEIESLLAQSQLVAGSRTDKAHLPFRIANADLDEARVIAAQYNSNIQAVLIAALHLYSFVSQADQSCLEEEEASE